MNRIVFLDTETTGLGSTDRLCQVAYKESGREVISGLFKPSVPVGLVAMSINHITDRMLESYEPFIGSVMYVDLKALLEDPNTVMVAHNAAFDAQMLRKEGIDPANTYCTQARARAFKKKGARAPEKHTLSYLRYYLELDVPENLSAHNAIADVLVLEKLYEYYVQHGVL